ncbi:MAG TPA: acyl-CoA dehydrogenase family protein [Acidimicrobiales bacterium]|nr:acyl-CoA dehydrogenase family protein [Acidimicrobiales bacterium]
MPGDVVAASGRLADEVLFPAALATDRSRAVPAAHLDALAGTGLYGLQGPPSHGGLGLAGPEARAVVEALAGGCLATTFVWVQHHRLVRALAGADAPAALRDEWLAPLCRGERRAGVALAGLLPGGALRASPAGAGWVLDGESPWVTGWGLVDVLLVAARLEGGDVAWFLVDAAEGPGVSAERQHLVAVDASATVRLSFDGLAVPAGRLVRVDPGAAADTAFAEGLGTNGSLALGVTGRCLRLLGPSPLDAELNAARARLAGAGRDALPAARAAASELALRAAAALVVHAGSRSVGLDSHPQRLAREALFLLVFGSRPPIKAALLELLQAIPST